MKTTSLDGRRTVGIGHPDKGRQVTSNGAHIGQVVRITSPRLTWAAYDWRGNTQVWGCRTAALAAQRLDAWALSKGIVR
jgi:hypothetical protein